MAQPRKDQAVTLSLTDFASAVTHFPKSVIGWMAQGHEINSAGRKLAAACCSSDFIVRSPHQPISRSLAPAGPHSPASVIGDVR